MMLLYMLILLLAYNPAGGLQYEGKTFTVAFFPNYVSMYGRSVTGHLFIRSQSGGNCSVTDDDGIIHNVQLNSTVNAITQFDLPGGKFYQLGEYVQKRGIYISCTTVVSVYGLSTRDQDLGAVTAFSLLPTTSIGMLPDYIVPSVPNNALIGVVAIHDNTSVSLDIRSNCPFLKNRNIFFQTKNLNYRDVYQIASDMSGQGVNCDLHGTRVTSNKPVALYSGATILLYPGIHGGQVINQVQPVPTWGREYIVPMIANMDKYTVRVVASHNNTQVTRMADDTRVVLLNESQVYQEDFMINQNVYVSSTKPVLVSQIAGNDQAYAVFSSLVPDISEYSTEYILPDMQAAGRHFERHVTIITETLCVPDIGVKANWTTFNANTHDISVTSFPDSSLREIKSASTKCKFAVQLTGFATYEVYAYFATPTTSSKIGDKPDLGKRHR